MNKLLLIVDDDPAMRGLLKLRLADSYKVIDTGNPMEALELALHNRPDAVLMDLMMPRFSGFELCQSLKSVSSTSRIPIFIVSGESGPQYKEYCFRLGAREHIEKPIDFDELKRKLAEVLAHPILERRADIRLRIPVVLEVSGRDLDGKKFKLDVSTENISAGGFLCSCLLTLGIGASVEISIAGRYAAKARVVRKESPGTAWQRYGFKLEEKGEEWPLKNEKASF